MGYYSDVAFAMKGNSLEKFMEKLEKLPVETRKAVMPLFHFADRHLVEENAECWFWKDIKWYACFPKDFPDVDFVEKGMNEADEEDFYFVRVGEEYDDNVIRGLWWDNPFGVTLCREIVLDC